jgi:hypothetical protein
MNENQNNQGQNFEPVETKKDKKNIGKKILKGTVKAGILALTAFLGWKAHDYMCERNGTYADAQAQREYRERRESKNN